jgi:hypothetical protein
MYGLALIAIGIAAVVLSRDNLFVAGISSGFILFGLLIVLIAEFVRWLRSRLGFGRRKTYGGLVQTSRGETVRSNSERRIADYFFANNIDYVYEREARSSGDRHRISRPDFFLPRYGVYVEYWGLLNVGDSSLRTRYEGSMKWKMAQYQKNNIRFISIYPKDLDNLDRTFRARFRDAAGFDLPRSR